MKLFQRLLYAQLGALLCLFSGAINHVFAQQSSRPSSSTHSTPRPTVLSIQHEIETARARLASSDEETRREAVMRLASLARPDASRVASIALNDSAARVRVAATRAVLSLPADESANLLIPLLNSRGRQRERDEIVRLSAAYALGETKSRTATVPLIAALEDRSAGVRGAAAVALGQIGDERAVPALIEILSRRIRAQSSISRLLRQRTEENEFVRRSALRALGQIGDRAAVTALIVILNNEESGDDLRREAARSLDRIGDPAAIPALRSVVSARDPYLARIAFEALQRLDSANRR
jgi:HEAT repeat protein